MSEENTVDYGPLTALIGTWKGDRGIDVAPEPDDTERNPFYETIEFEPAGDVDNAEKQFLTILRYHQKVYRKSNDEQFHDQIGYYTWEAATGAVTHSFVIPRGVGVVATGTATENNGKLEITTEAKGDAENQGVCQTLFMKENASTLSFKQLISLEAGELKYEYRTLLDIYGREFDHVDKSLLTKVSE